MDKYSFFVVIRMQFLSLHLNCTGETRYQTYFLSRHALSEYYNQRQRVRVDDVENDLCMISMNKMFV